MSSATSNMQKMGHKVEKEPVLSGGKAWLVWVLAVIFVIWLFNIQTGWAILKTNVQNDLPSITVAQIGLIAAVYTWVFAISQLFSGALLDKLGARRVLIPAIILVGAGAFLFASAQNFPMLLASQVVLAIGACAGFVGAGYVGGTWFGMAKFGFMFGLVQVVAALSSAFGQAGFDAALSVMSWRTLMYGFGIFGVILLVASFIWLHDPKKIDTSGFTVGSFVGGVFGAIFEALRNKQVVLVSITGAIFFGLQLALGVVWMPNLMVAHGFEQSQANLTSAALWLGLAVGSVFINKWTDRVHSRKQPYLITAVIMIICLSVLTWVSLPFWAALVVAAIFGIANSGHMLAFTIAGDNVPVNLIGTASSIVNGAMFIAGGLLMSIPGTMLAGTDGSLAAFQKPMAVFVGLAVVGTIIGAILKESFPKENA